MKFIWVSLLAASSTAEEENVALQSRVAVEGGSDSKLTYLSIHSDDEPKDYGMVKQDSSSEVAKKQKQLAGLVEQSSHLESAVQKRIAGQTISSIDQQLIQDVLDTDEKVEDCLETDVALQQEQATALNKPILDANHALKHDLNGASGVKELEGIMSSAREAHLTCRRAQVALEAHRDEVCKIYTDYAEETHTIRPQCQCDNCAGDAPDADTITSCLTASKKWVDDRASLVAKQQACQDAEYALQTKKTQCDCDQETFEDAFCAYAIKLRQSCADFEAALKLPLPDGAVVDRAEKLEKLKLVEKINKATSVAAKRLSCFISLFLTPDGCTPAASSACHTEVHDTSHLDITYPDLLAPATCDASPVRFVPGDAEWKEAEYPGASHILPVKVCVCA